MDAPRTRALVLAPVRLPELGPPAPASRDATGLPRAMADFLRSLISANTRRGYAVDLRDFVRDLLSHPNPAPVLKVKSPRVVEYRDRLIARGMAPGTIIRKLASLRSFYAYAVADGLIKRNPADPRLVRAPKRPNLQATDALSWNQVLSMLGAVDRSTPMGRRDYTLLLLHVRLGLRRSELVSIRAEDLHSGPPMPHLYVRRSKEEKARRIELRPDVFDALAVYAVDQGTAQGWLFPGNKGRHLTGDMCWRLIKKYARLAGLDETKVHTHSLRAAYITLCIDKNVPLPDIQRSVGHALPQTTLGYARDLEQVKSRAPRALDGLIAGGKPQSEENP